MSGPPTPAPMRPPMRQLPLAIGPEPQHTFDSFLVGRPDGANAAAVAHLRSLVLPSAPVYLWGAAGCGKTHLLRALAAHCRDAGLVAGWLDAGDAGPWQLQPGWSLVVLDRCEALDAPAQAAAFALFEEALAEGVQFAAAGRLPPVDLPLRDDLRTRLAWGHVFALESPGEAETRAALRREADRRGIFLSDEVMDRLLRRFSRDLGSLMRVLDRLDEFALAKSRTVTLQLLREMLREEGDSLELPASAESGATAEAGD